MNNQQFRRLVQESSTKPSSSPAPRDVSATPVLGSRQRSSIPMTPRSLATGSVSFAQQLRDRDAHQQKKFKSSAAPKGTKLASGYTDRAAALRSRGDNDDEDADSKASRIKALEEMVKLGQMEQKDFERVRDEITGGDVSSTHLVKGLDWKLLERVRRGEDVMSTPSADKSKEEGQGAGNTEEEVDEIDIDRELEDLEKREVKPVTKEERVKKGEMAPPPKPGAGKKRTRDDILRELKESRQKAKEEKAAAQPALSSKFKRVGSKMAEGPRIEIDDKGREVLITTDEDGNVKRKVRKAKTEGVNNASSDEPKRNDNGLLAVNKELKPLGMDVLIPQSQSAPEEEDDDIFADAGADYDPLADLKDESGSDNEDSASEEEIDRKSPKSQTISDDEGSTTIPESLKNGSPSSATPTPATTRSTSVSVSAPAPPKRNYFSTSSKRSPSPPPSAPADPLNDPTMLAAIQKASSIAARVTGSSGSSAGLKSNEEAEQEAARIKRRKEMLASLDRDADDMDLREDDEDDGAKVLSFDGKDQGGGEKKQKRKRGGKKRKGDGNNAEDVMKVLEGRKKSESK